MTKLDATLDILGAVPLFSGLTRDELEALAQTRVVRKYPRNATIINDGDTTNAIYIINRGKVKVCKTSESGKEVVIAVLDEGEHFGEMSLIDDKPRSASIVTKESCEFTIINKADFDRILMGNPKLAMSVMKGLCERLRAADRSIESLALMDVYGRIARVLLDMAEENEQGEMTINEPLTHKDIAQMVGSSREMVSRIFKDLVSGGYIAVEQKRITIKNALPSGW
ncbi:MAG: Crp/Fnr family transcriptional regulator [Gammaproteobacteria bacterium]|nr:Crp/Fnr family transcriptional regulator [Gammaproteobacteria bacterium]